MQALSLGGENLRGQRNYGDSETGRVRKEDERVLEYMLLISRINLPLNFIIQLGFVKKTPKNTQF